MNERLQKLRDAAFRWKGTPWVPNSENCQRGVSCHNLPRALYVEAGLISPDFPRIVGDPTESRHSRTSRMETFLDSRPELFRIPLNEIREGDLLGIRIYHCVDHLGVAISGSEFVHVLMHKHTDFDQMFVPPWQQRIQAAWRITQEMYGS